MSKVIQSSRHWKIVKPTRKERFMRMCQKNGFDNLTAECPIGGIKALRRNYGTCKSCKEYWNGVEEWFGRMMK